jgi:plasmid stabilization system protein ParE
VRRARNARGHLFELPVQHAERIDLVVRHPARFPRMGRGLAGPWSARRAVLIGRYWIVYRYLEADDLVVVQRIDPAWGRPD